MIEEKPITLQDIEAVFSRKPVARKKIKLMSKNTPLDRHYRLLDRIIRSL